MTKQDLTTADKHADRRDAQRHKKQHGMLMAGKKLKSVILPLIGKKAKDK